MEALLETLNARLRRWKPETADQVRERVTEIIGLAVRTHWMWCVPGRASRTFWIFSMRPRPGEIWLADLGLAAKTHLL